VSSKTANNITPLADQAKSISPAMSAVLEEAGEHGRDVVHDIVGLGEAPVLPTNGLESFRCGPVRLGSPRPTISWTTSDSSPCFLEYSAHRRRYRTSPGRRRGVMLCGSFTAHRTPLALCDANEVSK